MLIDFFISRERDKGFPCFNLEGNNITCAEFSPLGCVTVSVTGNTAAVGFIAVPLQTHSQGKARAFAAIVRAGMKHMVLPPGRRGVLQQTLFR